MTKYPQTDEETWATNRVSLAAVWVYTLVGLRVIEKLKLFTAILARVRE